MAQIAYKTKMSERMVKAMRYWRKNPVEAVKDWFGVTPEDYQGDMLNKLLKDGGVNRLAAKSGHGVGKTTTESWACIIFLNTRAQSRVVATAPTQHQLKDVLWPEVSKWCLRMPGELSSLWDISETHIKNKQYPKTWFATARTSNKQENLQGFHCDHILVLIDEASGVPANVFEVIEGILTNAEEHGQEAKLFMAGNPTQTAGEFYNAFNRNKLLYARYTVSGDLLKPKDKNGGLIYTSRRVTEKYRQTMASKYGLNSAVYDVRVRGLFPTMADDVVIPLEWAERAQFLELPLFDLVADPITLVMDPARFGGDETTLGKFRRGQMISLETWPKTSSGQCIDIVWEAFNQNKGMIGRIIVDEPGIGGPIIDGMRRVGLPITPYHGGHALSEANGDPEDEIRMFANRRSRDWWNVRRKFEHSLTKIPVDETLVNQLASVKFRYSKRDKIEVETKSEMKERLGDDASPDRADTVVMGLAPYHSLIHATPMDLGFESGVFFGADRPTSQMDW